MSLVWFPFTWGLAVKFCCLVAVFKSTFAGFFIFLSTWACQLLCWLRSCVVTVLSIEQCKKHPHSVLQLPLAEQSSYASHKDLGRCHSPSDLILRALVGLSAHPWHVLSQTPAFSFSSCIADRRVQLLVTFSLLYFSFLHLQSTTQTLTVNCPLMSTAALMPPPIHQTVKKTDLSQRKSGTHPLPKTTSVALSTARLKVLVMQGESNGFIFFKIALSRCNKFTR